MILFKTTQSSIFEKFEISKIGQWLVPSVVLPLLCLGLTFAIFKVLGMIHSSRDLFIIFMRGAVSLFLPYLIHLEGISSSPADVLGFIKPMIILLLHLLSFRAGGVGLKYVRQELLLFNVHPFCFVEEFYLQSSQKLFK